MKVTITLEGPVACGKSHLLSMIKQAIADFQQQIPSAKIEVVAKEIRCAG